MNGRLFAVVVNVAEVGIQALKIDGVVIIHVDEVIVAVTFEYSAALAAPWQAAETVAGLTGAINVASGEGSGCFDVPSGLSLFAKTAEMLALHVGACSPSGGSPSGFVLEALPVTVCCRKDEPPG